MNVKQTCSCSTCTCSNDSFISNYLENPDDCLTYAFITLYENSIWCMEIIYELFFKSLWQILMYVKQELQCDNKIISSRDRMSISKSTSKNSSLICNKRKYPEVCHREKYPMNMNRVASTSSTIDTHIVLIPVRSVYCQTEMWKNDLQTINIDLNQSETNQQLTDTFCRRLDEPLIFMNRELYGRDNRSSFCSSKPSGLPHSGQNFSQQNSELSPRKQSPINEGANENRSILYSADHNTDLPPITNAFPELNTFNKSSSSLLPNPTKKAVFSIHQRKSSQKKSNQKRRIIVDNGIPLTLATSLHSNVSFYNEDYFLKKYIHQLFTDKHYLR